MSLDPFSYSVLNIVYQRLTDSLCTINSLVINSWKKKNVRRKDFGTTWNEVWLLTLTFYLHGNTCHQPMGDEPSREVYMSVCERSRLYNLHLCHCLNTILCTTTTVNKPVYKQVIYSYTTVQIAHRQNYKSLHDKNKSSLADENRKIVNKLFREIFFSLMFLFFNHPSIFHKSWNMTLLMSILLIL